MNPTLRRVVLGVLMPLGAVGVIAVNIYMAHRSGHYYPLTIIVASILIGFGLDTLLFGLPPEREFEETLLPRTQVFLGVAIAAGIAIYALLEKGMI